jgi:succinyl-CoA synthetase beta subunit
MLLIEADGKSLFKDAGLPVPAGIVIERAGEGPELPGPGPWVVKAQVPVGGRGKAGGVAVCTTPAEVGAALARILGMTIKGHLVRACLVEAAARGAEVYLSIIVDAAGGGVRINFAREGGIEIEETAAIEGRLATKVCEATLQAVLSGFEVLLAPAAPDLCAHVLPAARKLAGLFFEKRLLLAEINPLFVGENSVIVGDAKVVLDGSVIETDAALAGLVTARGDIYRDVTRKIAEGFDFIDLDETGAVGLVTTGAGLSMMLIDELSAKGVRVANFCDIRTGQMRGDPARLVRVLGWLAAKSSLKAVFVNVFAGITDLAEFARLLVEALRLCPALAAPVIVRIVGRNEETAKAYLADRRPDLAVYSDMEAAMNHVTRIAGA